jgi:hypothetical protein
MSSERPSCLLLVYYIADITLIKRMRGERLLLSRGLSLFSDIALAIIFQESLN